MSVLLRLFLFLLLAAPWGALATAPSAAAFDAALAPLRPIWSLEIGPDTTARVEALAALLPPDDPRRALWVEVLRCENGDRDQADQLVALANRGLARAAALGEIEVQIRFHYCRAGLRELTASSQRAGLADYEAAIELAREHGLAEMEGLGLASRATSISVLGEQANALLGLLRAQQVFERAGLTERAESNLLDIGIAYRRMAQFDKADDYLRQSERFATRRGDERALYDILLQRGYLLYDRGDYAASLEPLRRTLTLETASSRYYAGTSRVALAASLIRLGEHAEALRLLTQATDDFAVINDASNINVMLHLRRGEALAGLGRHREAQADFAVVRRELASGDNLRYLVLLHQASAASLKASGQPAAALAEYERFMAASGELDRLTRNQQENLLRHQFDADRRDLENRRLRAEKALKDKQLAVALETRRWQAAALVMGGLLLIVFALLGVRQFRRARRLHMLAMTDALTGTANRRSLERSGQIAVDDARTRGLPVSVLTLDIDHFKPINDRHGHAVGDEVLRRVATVCQQALRQFDRLGRIGGEEFVAVLPRTPMLAAEPVAERLREAVQGLDLSNVAPELKVTVSIGVAEYRADDDDFSALLKRADAALYRAKADGRNRVEVEA